MMRDSLMGKHKKHLTVLKHMPDIEHTQLVKVCQVQSHSKNEHRMIEFLIKWLDSQSFKCDYYIDEIGNLIVTKGESQTYPCVVAHMDTVHKIVKDYSVWHTIPEPGKTVKLFAKKGDISTGIGGDDKCGIYACLYMLQHIPKIKVVFFTQEEVGCVGSENIDKAFFDDCRYVIQLDRRHAHDFIDKHFNGRTTSPEFRSEIGHLKKARGFVSTTGTITDSIKLWQNNIGISCVNISSGYYEPHTDNEYIIIDELWNSVQLAKEIILTLKPHRYECKPEPMKSYNFGSTHNSCGFHTQQQCSVCKTWKESNQGFEQYSTTTQTRNKFICYPCYSDTTKKLNNKSDKTLLLPFNDGDEDSDIGDKRVNTGVVWRTCEVCGELHKEVNGQYVNKEDEQYFGGHVWVCTECYMPSKIINIEASKKLVTVAPGLNEILDNNLTEDTVIETNTITEICYNCNNVFTNPYVTGTYESIKPIRWVCNECEKLDKHIIINEVGPSLTNEMKTNDKIILCSHQTCAYSNKNFGCVRAFPNKPFFYCPEDIIEKIKQLHVESAKKDNLSWCSCFICNKVKLKTLCYYSKIKEAWVCLSCLDHINNQSKVDESIVDVRE